MNSKKIVSLLLTTSIISTSLFTFVGCGKKDSSDSKDSASTEKDKDQFLNLLMYADPETLDVNKATNSDTFLIINGLNEGLARIKPENGLDKIIPAGAKDWKISDDGLVWTFNLRDYNWSDGKPVIAQHFVDSIQRLLDPALANEYAFFGFDIKNAEKYYKKQAKKEDIGVKAIDDKTLQITLEKPTPHFEKKLAFPSFYPIRLDVIAANGGNWDTKADGHVFSGPFKLTQWDKNNIVVLEKNDKYWDASNVNLNKLTFTYVQETSTRATMFENKDLDTAIVSQDYVGKWVEEAKKGKFKLHSGKAPTTYFAQFNQITGGPSGLMKNDKIRKAVSLAINRTELTKQIYGKHFEAYGLIPPSLNVGDKEFRSLYKEPLKEESESIGKDKTKLQALFKDGLKELGKDNSDLSKYSIDIATYGNSAIQRQVQEWWKQTLEASLGIKVNLNIYELKILTQMKKDGKYDVAFSGWHGDYNDPLTFVDLWTSNSGFAKQYGGYSNPEYDKLFAKLDGEKDVAKRGEIYAELEKLLVAKDSAIAPYMSEEKQIFYQNYVKDIYFPVFGPSEEYRWAYTSGR